MEKVSCRKSETKPYNYIYSLTVEANKIPKKGWNEIAISATRILAQTWSGDTIKDEYTISGNILLDIVTDRGTFSKKTPIK